jgi:hypothetical protein
MNNWSPKRRKYWGYKRKDRPDSTEQEESDSFSTEPPPMPWEHQDSAEDNTMYWKGEDSDEIDLTGETVLPTTVITAEHPQLEKSKSLIDQIQGKLPEDINPENFVNRIIMGMLGGQNNSSIPKVIGNNVILGSFSSSQAWNGGEGSRVLDSGVENVPSDSPIYQNKVWPSGFIYPLPDSFQLYGSRGYYLDVVGVGSHKGIDLVGKSAGVIKGQPILAIYDGEITEVVKRIDGKRAGIRVKIKSKNKESGNYFFHYYMHMEIGSNEHLAKGAEVKQGTIIGRVGSSNNETDDQGKNCHLHLQFEEPEHFESDPVQYFYELADLPQQPGSTLIWYK